MKKLSILLAFFMLFTAASYAKSAVVVAKPQPVKEVVKAKTSVDQIVKFINENPGLVKEIIAAKAKAFFPITIVTSCGTWTGTASCGSASFGECMDFINDVADFLESLC
jgi:hypothetical protein